MCILFEFLGFLTPPGGSSTIPDPKKGELSSFAKRKEESFVSLVSIPEGAYAISETGRLANTVEKEMRNAMNTENFFFIDASLGFRIPLPDIAVKDTPFLLPRIEVIILIF